MKFSDTGSMHDHLFFCRMQRDAAEQEKRKLKKIPEGKE
jgi:hypothetical protein